jgi:iron complex outermembrane recepter protein
MSGIYASLNKQIEVLKGPQGALYGRDAIGGAIIITTAEPSDHFEGTSRVGVGNGPSEKAQFASAARSIPRGRSGTARRSTSTIRTAI